jgi:hypothetical protein
MFLSPAAWAHIDIPLKWKLQQWEFVVLVQAQGRITNSANGVCVEKKIIRFLRGREQDLPKFETWQYNDLLEGRCYLLAYWNGRAPREGGSWAVSYNVERNADEFVVKAIQDNQSRPFDSKRGVYADLPLQSLEKLLKEVPYESNPTNTILWAAEHPKK